MPERVMEMIGGDDDGAAADHGTTNANNKKRKRTSGRRKIDIKPIQNEAARQVCFSKRRSGLFKKASELSILCGAQVAVLVFSTGNKPFSFFHPSSSSVLHRYLSLSSSSQSSSPLPPPLDNRCSSPDYLCSRLTELTDLLKDAKRKRAALKMQLEGSNVCLNGDVLRLGRAELECLKMQLERIKEELDISIQLRAADDQLYYMNSGWFMDAAYGYNSHSFCV